MTIIASNLREMAADTLVTFDGLADAHSTKIFRLDDGSIIGGAGASPALDLMMSWLRKGELKGNEPDPDKLNGEFTILRLRHDGLWLYADCVEPFKIKERFFAIGSGADVATYCMKVLKKPPSFAVREACKIDPSCGLPIDVLRLNKPRKGK